MATKILTGQYPPPTHIDYCRTNDESDESDEEMHVTAEKAEKVSFQVIDHN